MDRYFNLNGRLIPEGQAAIAPDSWAYRFGYGLFETMLFRNGAIRHLNYHWDRLEGGMRLLKIPFPKNFRKELESEIMRTLKANGLSGMARLRLQVTAGRGSFQDGDRAEFSCLIEAWEWQTPAWAEGLIIGVSDIQKNSGPYAHLKSCNALPYVLAGLEARKRNADDLLLVNEQDRIVESSIANIFWFEKGSLFTPPLSEGCVAGTMRRHLMETIAEKDLKTAPLHKKRLHAADAVFLTNALRGIIPVREIDGHSYSITPILPLLDSLQ